MGPHKKTGRDIPEAAPEPDTDPPSVVEGESAPAESAPEPPAPNLTAQQIEAQVFSALRGQNVPEAEARQRARKRAAEMCG